MTAAAYGVPDRVIGRTYRAPRGVWTVIGYEPTPPRYRVWAEDESTGWLAADRLAGAVSTGLLVEDGPDHEIETVRYLDMVRWSHLPGPIGSTRRAGVRVSE